jgi:biopolymer transport protein ExbD
MKEGEMHRVSKRTSRLIIASLIILILPLSWYCGEANTEAKQVETPQDILSGISECFDRIEVYTCCGKMEVDGKPTEFANLARTLEDKTGNPDSTIVVLRADNETHMGTVYDIQLVLVDLGLLKVVYAGMAGEGLPLRLPVQKDADRLEGLIERNLAVIYLDKSGGVSVRGERLETSKLGARVKAELAENEFVVFSIQTERDASFEEFLEVLGETKKAGATRIAIDSPL